MSRHRMCVYIHVYTHTDMRVNAGKSASGHERPPIFAGVLQSSSRRADGDCWHHSQGAVRTATAPKGPSTQLCGIYPTP